jgi:hypothetical protein
MLPPRKPPAKRAFTGLVGSPLAVIEEPETVVDEPDEAIAVVEPENAPEPVRRETAAERMRRIRRERAEARAQARFIVSVPLEERKAEEKQIESVLSANDLARKEADAAAKRDAVTRQVRWKSGGRNGDDVAKIIAAQERDRQGRRVRPEGTGRAVDGAHDDSSEKRGRGVLDRWDNTPIPLSDRPFTNSIRGIGIEAGGVDPAFLEEALGLRRVQSRTPWGAILISASKEFYCRLCGFTETWGRLADEHVIEAVKVEEQVFADTLRKKKWDREVWDEFLADNYMPSIMPLTAPKVSRGHHAKAYFRFKHSLKTKSHANGSSCS